MLSSLLSIVPFQTASEGPRVSSYMRNPSPSGKLASWEEESVNLSFLPNMPVPKVGWLLNAMFTGEPVKLFSFRFCGVPRTPWLALCVVHLDVYMGRLGTTTCRCTSGCENLWRGCNTYCCKGILSFLDKTFCLQTDSLPMFYPQFCSDTVLTCDFLKTYISTCWIAIFS